MVFCIAGEMLLCVVCDGPIWPVIAPLNTTVLHIDFNRAYTDRRDILTNVAIL